MSVFVGRVDLGDGTADGHGAVPVELRRKALHQRLAPRNTVHDEPANDEGVFFLNVSKKFTGKRAQSSLQIIIVTRYDSMINAEEVHVGYVMCEKEQLPRPGEKLWTGVERL